MNKQRGFGIVGVLLAFVAVGLIAGTGWYVYNSQKKTNQSLDNANQNLSDLSKQKESETTVKDETADWLLYEPPDKEYKVRIPDGWKLYRLNDTPDLITFNNSNLVYTEGTHAIVEKFETGGRGGPFPFQLTVSNSALMSDRGIKSSFTLKNGQTGDKYTFIQTEENMGHDLSKGDKEYQYYFNKGTTYCMIYYSVLGNTTDQVELVEKLVKTLEIL